MSRSRRAAARPEGRAKRVMLSIGTVILVITPISWILLHEPQADQAEASVPYVTRDDDTYIKTSAKPAVATPSAPKPTGTPTPVSTPGTPKPTKTPSVPGETPSTTPTDEPTTAPTEGPTDGPTDDPTTSKTPTRGPVSNPPKPSDTPSNPPTTTPPTTTTPPPPTDNGSMSGSELELFSLVDNARVDRGCAPLQRDSGLTGGARQDAETRAESGDVSDTSSSMAAAGGDGVTAKGAFDKLKSQSSGTLFNCGLDELGVGHGDAKYCSSKLLGICLGTSTRHSWVVDFK
ncbi:hypothetical protein [Kribbella catacumbae]|uniref:hypothetical protein n=1 Tax=Kribbella catacumbae TaxID=460086 RepID=UPI00058D6A5A|nr:hypothetical protein [Kribbella catacumbae]